MSDYISRDAAKAAVQNTLAFHSYAGGVAASAIDKLPAADVRPVVKASWEQVSVTYDTMEVEAVATMFCPKCKRYHNEVFFYGNPRENANFCPNCGADMKEET